MSFTGGANGRVGDTSTDGTKQTVDGNFLVVWEVAEQTCHQAQQQMNCCNGTTTWDLEAQR